MNKQILFLDLDNTIYPVNSIGEKLFKSLFSHIKASGCFSGNFEEIKLEIQRTPFQKVAEAFSFSPELFNECMKIHRNLTYNEPMHYFNDYEEVRKLTQKKHLVTSGFTKLQNSKIDQLGIRADFEEIHIIDLQISSHSKKDIFEEIIEKNNYRKEEILIIGDDLTSEIKAGNKLGIKTILYDRTRNYEKTDGQAKITRFDQLKTYL